jgi:hypothetical protein
MPCFDSFFELQPTSLGHKLQVQKARQVLHRLQGQHASITRMLEIGAGWGELADLSMDAHIDYHAIDLNRARAVTLVQRNVSVAIAQAPPVPIKDGEFDAVVALNVLEHMPDMPTATHFLREMMRLARPNGLVCNNCPDLLSAGKLFWDADYTHSFPVTMRRLSQMYRDLGLDIVDATFFAGTVSGPLATPISWLARLFPPSPAAFLPLPGPIWERIYRTRLTLLRNVFMIGRKTDRNLR